MPYHLRYTPYDLSSNNLTAFCDKYDKYIIAREQHSKDGKECPLHFHIYIESDYNVDTIRGDFLKKLSIPKCGMGRNNKYYMLKKWNTDVSYICKQGDIIACKGFELETLRVPPDPQKEEKKTTNLEQGPPLAKKKEGNFWKEILEEAMVLNFRKKIEIDMEVALKIISRVHIKKMLPLPHPGDRKRWATSLCMYARMGFDPEQDPTLTEKVIEDEALEFYADNMVKKLE